MPWDGQIEYRCERCEDGGREGSNVFCITIHPHGRIVLKCVHCGFKETGDYSDREAQGFFWWRWRRRGKTNRKVRDFRSDSLSREYIREVHEESAGQNRSLTLAADDLRAMREAACQTLHQKTNSLCHGTAEAGKVLLCQNRQSQRSCDLS